MLFVYSGARNVNSFGRFYQTSIEDWAQEQANAVCLVGYSNITTPEEVLAATRAAATDGLFIPRGNLSARASADIVLWSETAVFLAEPAPFLAQLADIARASGAVIGLGYTMPLAHPEGEYSMLNMFALVLPDSAGGAGINYQKLHPVLGVEDDVQPGSVTPPVVQSALGLIGVGICFDYDFPETIRLNSRGASLMLQPGWDWSTSGILHARMGAMRAVENGFTLLRCSSGGVSGVYTPYGTSAFETVLGTVEERNSSRSTAAYTSYVPLLPRVAMLYSYIGPALGIFCTVVWFGMMLAALLPLRIVNELLRMAGQGASKRGEQGAEPEDARVTGV